MQSFLYLQVDYCYNVDYVSVFIFVKCLCFRTVGNPDHLVFFYSVLHQEGEKRGKKQLEKQLYKNLQTTYK